MTNTSPASVSRQVIVEVPPTQAFELFTTGMDRWWPRHGFSIGTAPLREAVLEPWPGGRWFERDEDGSECSWGKVLAWEPPDRLVLCWQLSGEWTYDAHLITEVELRFSALPDGRTQVDLEHRLEGYGAQAAAMHDVYDSPQAWQQLLAGYADAVLTSRGPVDFDYYTVVRLLLRADAPSLSPEQADALQNAHMAFTADLASAGQILAAGPPVMGDEPDWRGLSIWATDADTTLALCAKDPAVIAGRLQPKLSTWAVPQGQVRFQPVRVPRSLDEVKAP